MIPTQCRICGTRFLARTREEALCPDCRLAAKRASYYRPRQCGDCGKTFVGVPRQKRCPECQAKAEAEALRRHRRLGPKRPLGSTDTCQRCGRTYTVRAGTQRYCPACAPQARADDERAKKRAEAAAKRASGIPTYHPPRLRVCVICGRTFRARRATLTCSPDCRAELCRRKQREADRRRRPKKQ